jgi:hypothetical protein
VRSWIAKRISAEHDINIAAQAPHVVRVGYRKPADKAVLIEKGKFLGCQHLGRSIL